MQRPAFAAIVLGSVLSCAAPVVVTPSPPATAPLPTAPAHAPPASSKGAVLLPVEANGLAAVAADGWLKPQVTKDVRGRVETLRFLEVRRSAFVENDAGSARITTFVAAHGALFGYGALGAHGESFIATGASSGRLAVVAYPKAERCPGLEVGLVYFNTQENGTLLGVPGEWVVHCPDPARPWLGIGDHVKTPGEWRDAARTARETAGDPFVAWLRERGCPELRFYNKVGGTKRLGLEDCHFITADPLELARTIAKKIIEIEKLPPLDREVVVRERGKKKNPRIVDVRLSQTAPPLTARHIDPSVIVSFSAPYQPGPQRVTDITIDADEEPAGPRPPLDNARTLPASFATSPEFLHICTRSGGMMGEMSTTLVDRRGDIYAHYGAPRSYAEDDIRRALRRGKRFVATLDPADTDTLAGATSRVALGKPTETQVVADGGSTDCVFLRRTATSGVLEGLPSFASRRAENVVVLSPEVGVVLQRMATLEARERRR